VGGGCITITRQPANRRERLLLLLRAHTAKSVKKRRRGKDGIIFKSMFSFFLASVLRLGYRSGPVLIKKMRRKPAPSEKGEGRQSNSSERLLKETHATRLSPLFYCICLSAHAAHFVALIKNAVSAAQVSIWNNRIPVHCLQKEQWERKIVRCTIFTERKTKVA
jgi:hypothetical protein